MENVIMTEINMSKIDLGRDHEIIIEMKNAAVEVTQHANGIQVTSYSDEFKQQVEKSFSLVSELINQLYSLGFENEENSAIMGDHTPYEQMKATAN
jgi:hypothetical protein